MRSSMRHKQLKASILKHSSNLWSYTSSRWRGRLVGKCWHTLVMTSISRSNTKYGTTSRLVSRFWGQQGASSLPWIASSTWRNYSICIKLRLSHTTVCLTSKVLKKFFHLVQLAMAFSLTQKKRPNLMKDWHLSSGLVFGKKHSVRSQGRLSNSWYIQVILEVKWAMQSSQYLSRPKTFSAKETNTEDLYSIASWLASLAQGNHHL